MTIAHASDGKGESRWSSRATGGLPRASRREQSRRDTDIDRGSRA